MGGVDLTSGVCIWVGVVSMHVVFVISVVIEVSRTHSISIWKIALRSDCLSKNALSLAVC